VDGRSPPVGIPLRRLNENLSKGSFSVVILVGVFSLPRHRKCKDFVPSAFLSPEDTAESRVPPFLVEKKW